MSRMTKQSREILHEVQVNERSFADVARQFGITRQRVYSIVNQEANKVPKVKYVAKVDTLDDTIIRRKRLEADLTLVELTEMSGISQATLSRAENREKMTEQAATKIANYWNTNIEELFIKTTKNS
jgi:plasmid maintenance system antidote protein VapI